MGRESVCSACGAPSAPGARFCGTCGTALGLSCPRCGATNPPDGSFCTDCGALLLASPAPGSDPESGERKLISVLFADVVGYTRISEGMDPEDVRSLMQRAFAVMQEEIHRFGGTVSQFLGDGLLALFGAPIAHEDHAQRSIRAGLAIQEALGPLREELAADGVDFTVRIGINTGPVVFGSVGTDLEFTLQATGDTVNTASRVQGVAEPGTVVATASTHRLAEGYFIFSDLGRFDVKNKAEPLQVFQALRPTGSRSRIEVALGHGLAPLVGRDLELTTVTTALHDAQGGRGHLVFVSGEPGIGKSRLLYEVRSHTNEDEVMWLTGRCISYGADIAYLPIVDLVKNACGIEEMDDEITIIAKLKAGVTDVGGDPGDLPYLRALLSVEIGDAAVEREEPALRKSHIFSAIRDVVVAASSRHTLVLAIEDLHWIDRPSLELLSHIGEIVPEHPILMLQTHRTEWDPPFGSRPDRVDVRLGGLSDEDALRLAQGTLGANALTDAIRDAVAGKADGNPFFVEELARSMSEMGFGGGTASVPDTVQDVIMARLDRLPERARNALQTASVIGREFTARLLERTTGVDASTEESVRELKDTQLIFQRSIYPELVYMFKHALTHDVAYESLLKERRRALHGIVADAIVILYADRLPELYEILGTHFERAERWSDAEHYLMLAAHKSMAAWAVDEAAAFSERALVALQRSGEQDLVALADVHSVRGDANMFLNRWTPACESYGALARLAAEAGDEVAAGSAEVVLSVALTFAHEFDQALEVTASAGTNVDPTVRAAAFISETVVHVVEGHLEHLHGVLDEIEQAAHHADDEMRSIGLGSLCELNHWMGNEEQALAFNDEALPMAMENELSQGGMWTFWDRGMVLTGLGRYEEALGWLERHRNLCRRVGDVGFWSARSMNTAGWTYMQIGAFAEGRRANEEGLELARRMDDPEIIRNAAMNLADCSLADGDPSAAMAVLKDVEESCAADASRGAEWMKWRYIQHLWSSLARAHLVVGEPEQALVYAERCLSDARRTRSKRYEVLGLQVRAGALGELGRGDQALLDAAGAIERSDQIGSPTLRWRARLALHDLLLASGRTEEGAEAAAEGLAILRGVADGLADPVFRNGLLSSDDAARLSS